MSDLNDLIDPKLPTHVVLVQAMSVNDSGQIVANGIDNSTGLSHAYILNPSGVAKVAEPTFSVIPRSYISTQAVALLDAQPGATIHYTLDGTQPTSKSGIYTNALTIDRTTTRQPSGQRRIWMVINRVASPAGLLKSYPARALSP